MERRIFLATLLSILLLILWSILLPKRKLPQYKPVQKEEKKVEKIKSEKLVEFENNHIKVVFNQFGGGIKQYFIKENKVNYTNMINIDICNFSTFEESQMKFEKKENKVTFKTWFDNLEVVKQYQFFDDYLNEIKLSFFNKDKQDKEIPLELCWSGSIGGKKDKKLNFRETKPVGIIKNEKYVLRYLKRGNLEQKYEWIGLKNSYFLLSFLQPKEFVSKIEHSKNEGYTIKLLKTVSIKNNEKKEIDLKFYLGPKNETILKKYNLGLEKSIDYGLCSPISHFALSIMHTIYKFTNNYGVSIIGLSVIIQLLFFPLTYKNLKSSKKMKELQPKIKLLQKTYEKDLKRLNTEIMHLYKTHKVNPLSGCLPLLIQLPIFWGLYAALTQTYQLRNANFILWIKDLSTNDPYYVLPILMGLSIFFQQQLSGYTDPTQKTFLYIMPIFITVIFLNMPSGLVLYWLFTNIVSLVAYSLLQKWMK